MQAIALRHKSNAGIHSPHCSYLTESAYLTCTPEIDPATRGRNELWPTDFSYLPHKRLHDAIDNVTLDDVYHGHQRAILNRREKIKPLTSERRKRENQSNAA